MWCLFVFEEHDKIVFSCKTKLGWEKRRVLLYVPSTGMTLSIFCFIGVVGRVLVLGPR
jgi:hypothetical protein